MEPGLNPAVGRAAKHFPPVGSRVTLRPVSVSLNIWRLLGMILASALLWMHYVRVKDRRQPEPRRRLLIAFLLGIVAWGFSALGYMVLEALGAPGLKFNERPWTAVFCFGVVGPLEEGAKVLMAYGFVFRWREFDEPIDGFVYASAISLGFASVENFCNIPELAWQEQLAHTAALPLTHMLFGAIWGFGIGHARFCVPRASRRILWQVGCIALGMFAHGLYDFLLLAYQATFVTSGFALALWLFVIWRARALANLPGAPTATPARADAINSPPPDTR